MYASRAAFSASSQPFPPTKPLEVNGATLLRWIFDVFFLDLKFGRHKWATNLLKKKKKSTTLLY